MSRIVAIDPLKRPRPADVARAAFVAAVAELIRSLAECENLPPRVVDALDGVSQAAVGLGLSDVGRYPQ